MKKVFCALLTALMLFCAAAACAEAVDVDSMDAETLLALREEIDARLRTLGAYPFVTLKSGDKSAEVEALQKRLQELGYLTGEVTGKYNNATVKAMKAFEKEAGLKVNGTATAEDQIALFAETAPLKPTPTPTKTPKPTKTPNRSAAYGKLDFAAVGQEPDRYQGKKLRFTGTVVQSLADADGSYRLRIATGNNGTLVVYAVIQGPDFSPAENDSVACFGTFDGLYTYTTADAQSVTLPAFTLDILEKIN